MNFVSKNLNTRLFEDSTALYTCNIQITVDSKNDFKPVVIASNPSVSDRILGINELTKYDYRRLIGKNKYVKFIIPLAVIILGSKDKNPRVIDAWIDDKLANMFYGPIEDEEKRRLEYVGPIIFTSDRRVYN
ncbi:hypothetical protein [Pedobacter sp.]|uniref:hypothetical protein n=1 Tax=Pedobacter sp. TaxID=1411316 RepID=UPI003D7FA45E